MTLVVPYESDAKEEPTRRQTMRRGLRLGLTLGDQAVVSGTNFLSNVMLAKALAKPELGVYGMAFAGLLFATEAVHALVSTPHQVLLARRDKAERSIFNGSALTHALGVGLLVSGIVAIVALAGGGTTFATLAAMAWAVLLRYFVRVFCFTTGTPGWALPLDVITSVIQLGGIWILWQTGNLSATTALLTLGTANVVSASVVLLARRREFRIQWHRVLADLSATWSLSRWIFASGIVWTVGTHGYPLLIGVVRDKSSAGIWFACYGLAAIANPLLMGITNSLGPAVANRAASGSASDLERFVGIASLAFAGVMSVYATAAFFLGEWMLQLLYDDKYAGFGNVVGIMALVSIVHALGFASSRGLFALDAARPDFVANILALGVMLGAGTWLTWSFGIRGAAVAMVLSVATGNVYRIVCFFRRVREKAGEA
ncbi:MAG: polysaccharide biosynthesis C-terminal domain-containing protein [Planctomycetota bacterium]